MPKFNVKIYREICFIVKDIMAIDVADAIAKATDFATLEGCSKYEDCAGAFTGAIVDGVGYVDVDPILGTLHPEEYVGGDPHVAGQGVDPRAAEPGLTVHGKEDVGNLMYNLDPLPPKEESDG